MCERRVVVYEDDATAPGVRQLTLGLSLEISSAVRLFVRGHIIIK